MTARKLTTPIIEDISHLVTEFDVTNCLERRNAYDANDNLEYQGFAMPGASAGDIVWLIIKHTWVAGNVSGYNLTRSQLADDEVKFDKEWDERATYFA